MADDATNKLLVSIEARTAAYEKALARAQAQTNTRMKGIEAALKGPQAQFQKTADVAARSLQRIEKQSSTSAAAISTAFKGVGAGLAAGFSAQAFAKFADASTRIENGLKVVGIEGKNLTATYQKLGRIALDNGASFEAVAGLYGKVSKASKELGATSAEVLEFTRRVAVGLKASGTDAAQASAGIMQLNQALASGVLRGDEFSSVAENLPVVADAIAKGMGVTVGRLRELAAEGALDARTVFTAFMRGSADLDAQAAKTSTTFSQAFQNIGTALVLAAGEFNRTTGASQAFADIVNNAVVPAITGLGQAISDVNQRHAALGKELEDFAKRWGIDKAIKDAVQAFNDLGNVTDPLIVAFQSAQAKVRAARGALKQDFDGVADDFAAAMADLKASGQEDVASGLSVAFVGLQAKIADGSAEARDFDSIIAGLVNTGNQMADHVAGRLEIISGKFANAGEAAKKAFDDAGKALAAALGENALSIVDALAGRLGNTLPESVGRFSKALREALGLLSKMDAGTAAVVSQLQANEQGGGFRLNELNTGPSGGFLNFSTGDEVPSGPDTVTLPDTVDVTPERRVDQYFADPSSGGSRGGAAAKTGEDIAAAFIRKFESYSGRAYWDVNAFRVGFGSDTTTSEGGKVSRVTPGTLTSLEAANRDLARRIAEFQSVIKGQVGSDVWTSFAKEQQAALTSIAYNYGKLPDRIVSAIQSGNPAVIDSAIRGLGSDNGGINKSRRNQEADLFSGGVFTDATTQARQHGDVITDLENQYQQLGDIGLGALKSIANALSDGKLEGKELLGILLDVAQQILSMPNLGGILSGSSAGASQAAGGIGGQSSGGGFLGGILNLFSGLFGFAEGGEVTGPVRGKGSGRDDQINAKLSRGEFVMNSRAAARNLPLLRSLNTGIRMPPELRLADGGTLARIADKPIRLPQDKAVSLAGQRHDYDRPAPAGPLDIAMQMDIDPQGKWKGHVQSISERTTATGLGRYDYAKRQGGNAADDHRFRRLKRDS
ncbi:tape measure protein [Mesorhizobium sp. IMUNJ 23232]|uniref:tape measure protein n=1 Tax=Mesorhizobium sp. IMUNJ 23232 TaxID=3376064 RepID=UPI0037984142